MEHYYIPQKTLCETCKAKCSHAGKRNRHFPAGGPHTCKDYRITTKPPPPPPPQTPYTTEDDWDLSQVPAARPTAQKYESPKGMLAPDYSVMLAQGSSGRLIFTPRFKVRPLDLIITTEPMLRGMKMVGTVSEMLAGGEILLRHPGVPVSAFALGKARVQLPWPVVQQGMQIRMTVENSSDKVYRVLAGLLVEDLS